MVGLGLASVLQSSSPPWSPSALRLSKSESLPKGPRIAFFSNFPKSGLASSTPEAVKEEAPSAPQPARVGLGKPEVAKGPLALPCQAEVLGQNPSLGIFNISLVIKNGNLVFKLSL